MTTNLHSHVDSKLTTADRCLYFSRGVVSKDFREHRSVRHEAAPTSVHLRAGARCVRGGYRKSNEDKCFTDVARGLFLVADGMGGHVGGAEASRIIMKVVPGALQSLLDREALDADVLQHSLRDAVEIARHKMILYADNNPDCYKMGATMAVSVIKDHRAYIARVGDCRVYLVRGKEVKRLTRDQTFAQELGNCGALSDEQIRESPYRHVMTNSLGIKPLQYPLHIDEVTLQPSDRIVLVTDGATDALDDEAIKAAAKHGCPTEAVDQLVLDALRQGSHDNIGCIVVKVIPDSVYWHKVS